MMIYDDEYLTVSLNCFQVAMAGDFILAVASMMIARLRSDDVTLVLSQVTTTLSHIRRTHADDGWKGLSNIGLA